MSTVGVGRHLRCRRGKLYTFCIRDLLNININCFLEVIGAKV